METMCEHVVHLLQSDFNSTGLIGDFFIKCLNHLAVVLGSGLKPHPEAGLGTSEGQSTSSSALLECEGVMPLSSSEVERGITVLSVTSALCEHMSERVLAEAPLPSLVAACKAVLNCHARCLEERGDVGDIRLSGTECCYGDMMMGGHISLDMVFRLLTTVLVKVCAV